MNTVMFITAVVLGLLLAETRVSRVNEAGLRARGAIMPPGDVYLALLILYPAAFMLMGAEGVWRASVAERVAGVSAGTRGPSWLASGVLLFTASKALKYWAVRSLGDRWTFRVFAVPNAPLVTTGPYRYVTHPNYIAVVGELVGTAMMVGAPVSGPIMVGAFGVALRARVRFENQVLRALAGSTVSRDRALDSEIT
jgi:methyltransferase